MVLFHQIAYFEAILLSRFSKAEGEALSICMRQGNSLATAVTVAVTCNHCIACT